MGPQAVEESAAIFLLRPTRVSVLLYPPTFGVLHAMFVAFTLATLGTESLTQDHLWESECLQ